MVGMMNDCSHQTGEEKPRYEARHLTGSSQMAEIDLDGQVYTLRITKYGKLILTK